MEAYFLDEEEALLVQALEQFTEEDKTKRSAGDRWMVYGPKRWIPPISVKVIEKRGVIHLKSNEGIYVRNRTTGDIRLVAHMV